MSRYTYCEDLPRGARVAFKPGDSLKGCPFCGHKPRMVIGNGNRGAFVYIKCPYCEVQTKAMHVFDATGEWWNSDEMMVLKDKWEARSNG